LSAEIGSGRLQSTEDVDMEMTTRTTTSEVQADMEQKQSNLGVLADSKGGRLRGSFVS
jgi:hypothetical protein